MSLAMPTVSLWKGAALFQVFSVLTLGKGQGRALLWVSFPHKADVFNPPLWKSPYSFHPEAVVPRISKVLSTFWSFML